MDLKLKLANLAILLGFLGSAASWVIGWNIETRVFSSPVYVVKTLTRTDVTWIKSKAYYLEPEYAVAFRTSVLAFPWAMGLALLGGGYVELRKRKSKSEQAKLLAQSAQERDESKE
ncbi:hypothetical protein [Novosphingobium fuchskuhlense]|nr:hypothetical protein [Novosphingobium fuchskuhlense]